MSNHGLIFFYINVFFVAAVVVVVIVIDVLFPTANVINQRFQRLNANKQLNDLNGLNERLVCDKPRSQKRTNERRGTL